MSDRPDLLVHIGHGKTGSTAIQRTLQRNAPALAAAGVLWPDADGHANHQEIFHHLTGEVKRAPGAPASPRDDARRLRRSARLWETLLERIAAERPRLVVLSCENQFRPFALAALARLSGLLAPQFGAIRVVAYLRAPASHFLSAAQQDLKKRPEFEIPSRSRYRDTLEPWMRHGPGPVTCLRFGRADLRNGDVVEDFCTRFLPLDFAALTPMGDPENVTVSAEAMEMLQTYFRGALPPPHPWYGRRPQRMKALIRAGDAATPGFAKPCLHAGLKEAFEARATDLGWLEDTFGITFDEVEPAAMSVEAAEARVVGLRDVADICPIDPERRAALQAKLQAIAAREQRLGARIARAFGRARGARRDPSAW
jgi:hypothetical protein